MTLMSGIQMSVVERRKHWMSVLSRAPIESLEACCDAQPELPEKQYIRAPEVGLMMVRARAGGSGAPFNMGEMTMTRCVVALEDGASGFGYVQGRNKRHAELAAVLDAMLQDELLQQTLMDEWVTPMYQAWLDKRRKRSKQIATTKVDFFTMVRGE